MSEHTDERDRDATKQRELLNRYALRLFRLRVAAAKSGVDWAEVDARVNRAIDALEEA